MLFNSYVFVFAFLPVVLALWHVLRNLPWLRLAMLTAASYVFYGYWDWRFTILMFASTVVDYVAGGKIHVSESPIGRKTWLIVSIASNLSLLGFFKYAGFMVSSANGFRALIDGGAFPVPDIVLPIGISFYTFQSMSYSIDIYRRSARPADSFLHFCAYVSLFPQLVAGPIVRYTDLEAQLRDIPRRVPVESLAMGLQFFVFGLAKKLLIADVIASRINPLFADAGSLDLVGAWTAMLGYTMQIYFDFSGYSDMAVGLGLLLGFRMPQNFDSPYKSRSISEFWRRWHMTLSFWLRDYLYISLGGSRKGRGLTLVFLATTMFLGGLWHGAAWTFVVWGLYHGFLLVIYHLWKEHRPRPLPDGVAWAVTFLSVVVGWVFFRASSFGDALHLMRAMVGLEGASVAQIQGAMGTLAITAAASAIAFYAPNTFEVGPRLKPVHGVVPSVPTCVRQSTPGSLLLRTSRARLA
jgi:alginate O-acetyltransferase complex protein AlgI